MPSAFVLDTSAIITVLNQEDGVDEVLSLINRAREQSDLLYIPFIALMELEYLLLRKLTPEETMAILSLVNAWPIEVPESTEEWRNQAALVKSTTILSVADAWIAAFALIEKAELMHKDPEYDQVIGLQAIRLPDKA